MRHSWIGALAWVGVAPALVGCAALIGCAAPSTPAERYLSDPVAVKRGRSIFIGTCGGYCHPTKPGNRDAPYLFDCNWKHGGSDAELFASISGGYPDSRMPAWGGLLPDGDADIWKVIAYLRSASNCQALSQPQRPTTIERLASGF